MNWPIKGSLILSLTCSLRVTQGLRIDISSEKIDFAETDDQFSVNSFNLNIRCNTSKIICAGEAKILLTTQYPVF